MKNTNCGVMTFDCVPGKWSIQTEEDMTEMRLEVTTHAQDEN